MIDISYIDILKIIRAHRQGTIYDKYNIMLLSNVSLHPFENILKYYLLTKNIEGNFITVDNNFPLNTCLQLENKIADNVDCIILLLYLPAMSPSLSSGFGTTTTNLLNSEIERISSYVHNCISLIRQKSKSVLLINEMNYLQIRQLGIFDTCINHNQNDYVNKLNRNIKKLTSQFHDTYYVGINHCLLSLGSKRYYDDKQYTLAKMPYSLEAMYHIAYENYKYIQTIKGLSKKCLILDCDGILWGGIVGEDGVDGILLNESKEGLPYIEFQRTLSCLESRGVILALCSKNNEEDVLNVFSTHSNMILKTSNIATHEINWNNKVDNIIKIQQKLNVAFNSMVFIDDNLFEIDMVKKELPEVSCLHFPECTSYKNSQFLLDSGYFEQLSLTSEDKNRTLSYLNNQKRMDLRTRYLNIEDYLSELEMSAIVFAMEERHIDRVHQLIHKTNQFNMTCMRYSRSQVQLMLGANDSDIVCLNLKDKYDNMGIIGIIILKYLPKEMVIENIIVSCRALSRGVEVILLFVAEELARKYGADKISAIYQLSQRNQQVAEFYPRYNYTEINTDGENKRIFMKNVVDCHIKLPAYYRTINHEIKLEII